MTPEACAEALGAHAAGALAAPGAEQEGRTRQGHQPGEPGGPAHVVRAGRAPMAERGTVLDRAAVAERAPEPNVERARERPDQDSNLGPTP